MGEKRNVKKEGRLIRAADLESFYLKVYRVFRYIIYRFHIASLIHSIYSVYIYIYTFYSIVFYCTILEETIFTNTIEIIVE